MKITNLVLMFIVISTLVVGVRYWDMHLPDLQAGIWGGEWNIRYILSLPLGGFALSVIAIIIYMWQIEYLELEIKECTKQKSA